MQAYALGADADHGKGPGIEALTTSAESPSLHTKHRDSRGIRKTAMAQRIFTVHVRPLAIAALNKQLPENVSHEPGDVALWLLEGLAGRQDDILEHLRHRYDEVSGTEYELFAVPAHRVIMRHVIQPLKEAKQCYVLGMSLPCIAQAGLVGEMVALWRFRMLQPLVVGKPLDQEMQKLLRGREFDRLIQEERVRVLRALDPMDQETVQCFGDLRALRRQYLHYMVDPQNDIDSDAKKALKLAIALVNKTLDTKFDQGKILLAPNVWKYIEDIVRVHPEDEDNTQAKGQRE